MSAVEQSSPWTVGAFLKWQTRQDDRYELVGGFPVKLMTGASRRHDRIVVNLLLALGNRLQGKPCQPFTADGAVETFPGQIRRTDIGVECGAPELDTYLVAEPTALFEVLSPSTRNIDHYRKLEEYKAMRSVRHIVIVEPKEAAVLHLSRDQDGWRSDVFETLEKEIPLSAIEISLPLCEIYAGIEDIASSSRDAEQKLG